MKMELHLLFGEFRSSAASLGFSQYFRDATMKESTRPIGILSLLNSLRFLKIGLTRSLEIDFNAEQ